MKTLSLKLPETLYGDLTALAEHQGVSKSALVREALAELFRQQRAPARGSALALLEREKVALTRRQPAPLGVPCRDVQRRPLALVDGRGRGRTERDV